MIPPLPGVKRVVAVAGGKGGVGKSTLAVNLAAGAALSGAAVGLLDLDLEAPGVPIMIGRTTPLRQEGDAILPVEAHGLKVMSAGFLPPSEHGPGTLERLFTGVRWGELDYLFIDLPPGIGPVERRILDIVPLSGVVIVTMPQDVALQEAAAGVEFFRRSGVEVLGIVENMSFHVCSSCGHRDNIFGHGGAADAARRLGTAYLGAVPIDSEVRKCSDSGMPVVLKKTGSPSRDALLHVVRNLEERLGAAALAS